MYGVQRVTGAPLSRWSFPAASPRPSAVLAPTHSGAHGQVAPRGGRGSQAHLCALEVAAARRDDALEQGLLEAVGGPARVVSGEENKGSLTTLVLGGEETRQQMHELWQVALDPPLLALRAAPKGRRVEDDAVEAIAAPNGTRDIRHHIIHEEAQRRVGEPREDRVGACARDCGLGAVHVHNLGAALPGGQRRPSCVRKEVKHPTGGGMRLGTFSYPAPIRLLLGEDSNLTISTRPKSKGDL
mmetsp:Transcript_33887/g.72339  ORF Transcript_33887/g.72339 Transcript_33887/m.72339 type:complete len:242 (+) Transcript_33887:364-1089(+)